MGYQAILDAFRALPTEDQLRMLQQIQDEVQSHIVDDDLTSEQQDELDRRLADIEANPGDGVPWEQVRAEARARHKQ